MRQSCDPLEPYRFEMLGHRHRRGLFLQERLSSRSFFVCQIKTCLRSVARGRQRGEAQRRNRSLQIVNEDFEPCIRPDHGLAVRS